VGSIGGNTIYGVKASEMVPIKPAKPAGKQSWGTQMVGAVNRRLNPTQHEVFLILFFSSLLRFALILMEKSFLSSELIPFS